MRIRVFTMAVGLMLVATRLQAQSNAFNMQLTVSDGAQRATLAFDGLAIMTGNLEGQTFFPPGKVADYTGFQYLRDNDPDNMGHNTSFLTRVANNVLYILNTNQLNQLKGLAVTQLSQIDEYGYRRYPLMKAFRRLLDGDVPAGSAGLDPLAVKQASRELYLIDGRISFDRALVYSSVINSFDAGQIAYLDAMKGQGWNSWPDITDAQVRSKLQGLPQGTAVAVMTYAGDLFSWYAGSLEADVYFCPERQGTYYGGFYIKDAPAIGHEGYSIDEQLTATAGAALCDSSKGYVTTAQAAKISSLVSLQRTNLYAGATNIVSMRSEIATLLRSLLVSTASSNAIRSQILDLSGIYGELDGENNYYYATIFAQVYAMLDYAQKTNLAALRHQIMSGTYSNGPAFDFTVCTNFYLYSAIISDTNLLTPFIGNTDDLFLTPVTNPPFNVVLGCPTADSIVVNLMPSTNLEAFCEYSATPDLFTATTALINALPATPSVWSLNNLPPDSQCYYRIRYRVAGETNFSAGVTHTFHTQRAPGKAFTFSLQGDSHPERVNLMFESAHYSNTLSTVAADTPDFYLTLGDDFSVDNIPTNLISQPLVAERYTLQRPYLGLIGQSAPLFLVNGNHEQAAAYLLDGTSNNIAVWAQNARNTFYPQPAPDSFYTGNTNVVSHIGLLRNYFAWTWGDALFVTIDPYWESLACVDNNYWTKQKRTNLWDVTHGDPQYQWLKQTLERSTAKYKFVFAHHVLGTGRGGVEEAGDYEWGGHNGNGSWGFDTNRPTWALPIHQLMASNHVTIFFQGHDHIFAHQQLDGVTYLTLPNPADPNYSLFNSDAYTDVIYKTNNSGYVRVNVSTAQLKVDYVRTYLPAEEAPGKTNGMVDYSFIIGATNPPPAISAVNTGSPLSGSPITVSANVADATGLGGVWLNYSVGAAASTNTIFLETMATNAVKPWTGGGCDNAWVVTGNFFEQRTNSNYGSGNPCGMEFKAGTTNPADSMIWAASPIDARGSNAVLSFAFWANGLTTNTGWAMQLDSGGGFTTRLSELTGSNHNWVVYNYALQPEELVGNLFLRFQFQGGSTNNRVALDQISLESATSGGGGWVSMAMTMLSNGVYTAQIPAQLPGAVVNYYISATNMLGLSSTYPAAGASAGLALTVVETNAPTTNVAVAYNLLLGRPTRSSMAVSLLASNDLVGYFEYGTQAGVYTDQTAIVSVTNGIPSTTIISGLAAGQKYFYRLRYAMNGIDFGAGGEGSFRTQRQRGDAFTFDIEADPHNRDNEPAVWQRALTNMLADVPDFLIDLGDTFMEEKLSATNDYFLTQQGIYGLHREVRDGFFGIIGHSVPLFLVNGNHEAELGWLVTGANSPGVWGAQARQYYFPVPQPGDFYTGAFATDPNTLGPRDGYYAFEWGDALIVVLDPYWFTIPKPVLDGWGWTLGANQYFWLKRTLENSTAKFKFVFAHHLIGGSGGSEARGGKTYAPYYEWGGLNTNGTYGFATQRPGWPAPIQDLLISNKVQVFFHGHDHLFVKENYDANNDSITDLVYQEVPQPSRVAATTNAATGYGYTNSLVLGNSGHLRVTVTPSNAVVEYVRVFLPANETASNTNRMVSYTYTIPAGVSDSVGDGIPDWWRARYFGGNGSTTNNASAATSDIDNDGLTTLQEYLADTDPTNMKSRLRITGQNFAGPDYQLNWTGGQDAWQFVETSSNLALGSWQTAFTNPPMTSVSNSFTFSNVTATSTFYRIKVRRYP